MPELPEVQTIIFDLNRKIKGGIITDFWSDWPKAIKEKSLKNFKREIRGRKILGARRIGKNIFIDLSGKKILYIHLKMTGHLLVKTKSQKSEIGENYFTDKVNQYIHHIWYLDKGKTLEFSDVRKFAKIALDDAEKINNLPEVKNLGVDVMSRGFTLDKFREVLGRHRNKSIGLVLVEQSLFSGIGNIYRSEILFEAKIFPARAVKSLNNGEVKRIHHSIKKILRKAVKMRGTSDSDYRDTAGAPGRFQKFLKVYRRAGKPCDKCGKIVRRSILGQRSVFYCPLCQR